MIFNKKNKKEEVNGKVEDSKNLIEVKDIKKNYGKVDVLRGISFNLLPGEKVAIVGANGAGKSTLSEIISKVKEPSSGKINYSFGKTKSEISSKIGIQFQDSSYPDFYKVKDLVSFMIEISDIEISKEEIEELYNTFDLTDLKNKVAKGLSGGQQQRLNILLAIVNNPKLLILDEVGTGLDIESRTKIKSYIKDYSQKNNSSILLVSHNADEVMELVDRIIVLHNGLIWEDKQLKDIIKEWKLFDSYMNNLYLNVFKQNLDLRFKTKKEIEKIDSNEKGLKEKKPNKEKKQKSKESKTDTELVSKEKKTNVKENKTNVKANKTNVKENKTNVKANKTNVKENKTNVKANKETTNKPKAVEKVENNTDIKEEKK